MHSPPTQPGRHSPVPPFHPDRHLGLVERVLHDVVGVPLVDALDDGIDIRHERVGDQEELGAGVSLETGQSEEGRFQRLEPGDWEGRVGDRGGLLGGCRRARFVGGG
jgi:hypothetical protein